MISLAFSIFLDSKISGVTLFVGMADWRNDGTERSNTSKSIKVMDQEDWKTDLLFLDSYSPEWPAE